MVNGMMIRANKLINPTSGRALILKVDWASRSEAEEIVKACKDYCEGIVVNREQINDLSPYFLGKKAPALIIRIHWIRLYEGGLSSLYESVDTIISAVEEAMVFGASAIFTSFLIGHERDEDEARNVESISFLSRACEKLGIPLMVECLPLGERITKENFSRCIELGARVSTEAGADIVAIPYTGDPESFKKIVYGINTPTLLLDIKTPFGRSVENLDSSLKAGAKGIVVGEEMLRKLNILDVKGLYQSLHGGM